MASRWSPARRHSSRQWNTCSGSDRSLQTACISRVASPYTWTCQSSDVSGAKLSLPRRRLVDPREPVAAVHRSRASFARAAATIVDGRLRDGAKHEPSRRSEPERQAAAAAGRRPSRTRRASSPSLVTSCERPIGRRDQPSRERDALGLVGVEEHAIGATAQHGRQLPRQVHGVADAGVHPLAADGAVDVRRIAEQERAAAAEMIGDAMVHAVGREPVHAVDLDAHATS